MAHFGIIKEIPFQLLLLGEVWPQLLLADDRNLKMAKYWPGRYIYIVYMELSGVSADIQVIRQTGSAGVCHLSGPD